MNERIYVLYRRIKAFGNSLCFYFFRVFPIKQNRIVVCSFEGRSGFNDNPKYIVKELHEQHPELEIIWLVNQTGKKFPDYVIEKRNSLFSRAYYLTTAKVWIDNYRKPYGTVKRKGQYYMNTTHGMIGFKCIGLWRGDGLSEMAYRVIKNDSDMIDDMLIDSEWCAEMCPDGMIYYGNYLRTGDPRVDILYGDKTYFREKFRKEHGLSFDTKIVLFAPTFREANKSGKRSVYENQWTLDFERLLKNFEKKFGGNWVICLRLHPQLAEAAGEYKDEKLGNKLIDVTKIEDLYEIMAAVDACVSDYSTTAFDSSLMHIPVFLYADDIDSYLKDRGGMIWNISSDTDAVVTNKKEMTPNIDVVLPFSISQNNDEFERKILNFDEKAYLERLKAFEKGVELVFDGKASKRAVERIEEYLKRP